MGSIPVRVTMKKALLQCRSAFFIMNCMRFRRCTLHYEKMQIVGVGVLDDPAAKCGDFSLLPANS